MNLKAIIAGLVITASSVMVPEAVKAQAPEGQLALWNAIEATGTTIKVNECEEEGANGWFSYYTGSYQDMEIQICTNVAQTTNKRWETLRHEAVHLAQKCENPDHGDSFETLKTWSFLEPRVREDLASFIMESYPRDKWAIETEAFVMMKFSNFYIADLVNEACN